jgi:hypothetical protein
LAGEGIELPIATEHNLVTDYAEAAEHSHVEACFTPVSGCEVTTVNGHFNAFPIRSGSRAPDFHLTDWPRLMESIRATPGVRVIVLNHPRDLHEGFCPFAETNFNAVTGANRRGSEFTMDAMELINSGALRSDLMQVYRDWFALLNHGYRITGVGASDSHDVSRFIVGQGRTYIACPDDNPSRLDMEEACRSLLRGRALVSMGLLTNMKVEERFGVGDLATGLGKTFRVGITVLGPSWASADRLELFANGVKIREQRLDPSVKVVQKARITWLLQTPAHDMHLVAIASGPGVMSPHWAIPRPYQPSSRIWESRVIGSTNPIWIDADGDGKFTAAREYAMALIGRAGYDPAQIVPALAGYDEAVAAQVADLCHAAGKEISGPEFRRHLGEAGDAVRRGFDAFARTVTAP